MSQPRVKKGFVSQKMKRTLNKETNDFHDLVGKLEGVLDANDIKDKELVSKWYDFWIPLETRRAAQGNNIDKEKAIKELNMMKGFFKITNRIATESEFFK